MRLKVLIPALIVLSLAIAVLFWHRPAQRPSASETPQGIVQATNPLVAITTVATQAVIIPLQTAIPQVNSEPFITNNPKALDATKQFIEQRNAPIDLYGRVIDQDSNSLSGAKIKIGILHLTMPNPLVPELGSKNIQLEQTSDIDGRFEFHGETGEGFGVGITKDGYELEQDKYGSGPTAGSYDNPVVFKMWSTNIHEQLITGDKKFQIVPDGRMYFINLTDGTIAETGAGNLKVWIKRPAPITYGKRYDWSCEMDVLNGGLLAAADSSMYLAPVDGYTPSFQFEQKVGSGWGDTTGEKRFYVRLNNGQEYGHITIELIAYYNDQIPGMIRLSYAINPSGSRILR